jgi:hypothetical protein
MIFDALFHIAGSKRGSGGDVFANHDARRRCIAQSAAADHRGSKLCCQVYHDRSARRISVCGAIVKCNNGRLQFLGAELRPLRVDMTVISADCGGGTLSSFIGPLIFEYGAKQLRFHTGEVVGSIPTAPPGKPSKIRSLLRWRAPDVSVAGNLYLPCTHQKAGPERMQNPT